MTLEELVENVIHLPAKEYRKKEQEDLAKFLNVSARLDKDGTEFMQMLERSKMHFGPYAL